MVLNSDSVFDKYINVSFNLTPFTIPGSDVVQSFDNIVTPLTGRKPQISISGLLVGNNTFQTMELRLTNYYHPQPLKNYKSVTIRAGYKTGQFSIFEGQIFSSYVDKPPPDSETVFTMITGQLDAFVNQVVTQNFTMKGSTLGLMLQTIAGLVGQYNGAPVVVRYQPDAFASIAALPLPCDFNFNASAMECLRKIQMAFSTAIKIQPEGNTIFVYNPLVGTSTIHVLDYIISARNDIGTFTIVAPWLPSVRPGDVVMANPAYFAMAQGGQFVGTNLFRIVTCEFAFDTCGEQNQMTLLCVPAVGSLV